MKKYEYYKIYGYICRISKNSNNPQSIHDKMYRYQNGKWLPTVWKLRCFDKDFVKRKAEKLTKEEAFMELL